jgi:hypothetical protein
VTTDEPLTPWPEPQDERWARLHDVTTPRGEAAYRELLDVLRLLQDRIAGGAPPPAVASSIAAALRDAADALGEHQVEEAQRWDGWHPELPGRGLPVVPPYVVDGQDGASLHGRVTFTRYYLGGNAAAHGGTQPLLFDDVFGRIANHGEPGVARTAYLHVNYRSVTPLNVELRFVVGRERMEGRKRWVTGRIELADGTVCCDAEALFLQLLPGQQ